MLQALADKAGYAIVAPDRADDLKGGPEAMAAGFGAMFSGEQPEFEAGISTDGTHLVASYEYAQKELSDKVDCSNLAVGGWSMGVVETINAVALLQDRGVQIKNIVMISGAMGEMMAPLFGFAMDDLLSKTKKFSAPSIWVTVESDGCKKEHDQVAAVAPNCCSVCYKDSAMLNVDSLPHTLETCVWPKAALIGEGKFPGMAEHCSLMCEAGNKCHVPIAEFLASGRVAGSPDYAELKQRSARRTSSSSWCFCVPLSSRSSWAAASWAAASRPPQ